MINKLPLRAVLDTNIIISALTTNNQSSPTRELLNRWLNDEFVLMLSIPLYAEYVAKLNAKQIPDERKRVFLTKVQYSAQFVVLQENDIERIILDDPDDDIVVGTALAGGATHLVTYDAHLRDLGSPFRGIEILDGLHFLYAVRGDTPPE